MRSWRSQKTALRPAHKPSRWRMARLAGHRMAWKSSGEKQSEEKGEKRTELWRWASQGGNGWLFMLARGTRPPLYSFVFFPCRACDLSCDWFHGVSSVFFAVETRLQAMWLSVVYSYCGVFVCSCRAIGFMVFCLLILDKEVELGFHTRQAIRW